ncbi:MAG: benzylsuccinate CoA-transferase BbsF subunit, partial [Candidatus Binatota bacterium]|nr:benzylsuccinate CoA-transferase BbsF subunit [Candidatus Binatota bacterium]
AIRPDVVYAAISGFGIDPETPYYDFIAWGPNQAPLIGLDEVTGWADRPPSGFSVFSYPDFTNGLHAAVAVMAALEHRARTGEGQSIDLAQLEATAAMLGPWLLDAALGDPPRRDGNRAPGAAPHGIYPSRGRERWVAIAVFSDDEWRKLCTVAERPEWRDDPRFATAEARLAHQDPLDEAISAWTRTRSDDEVAEWLQRAGIAAAPVLDNPRVTTDPQLRDRGFWIVADHARLGRDLVTGSPIRLSATPGTTERAGPALGQDNAYVLREVCGYSEDEIAALTRDRVVLPMAHCDEAALARPYFPWIRHFMPDLPWVQPAEPPPAAGDVRPAARSRTPRTAAGSGALAGLRVIDLTEGGAAYAPRLLADLGAEVTKIEPPGGSPMRLRPATFATLAGNRTRRTIDLTRAEGRSELASLIRSADVVCDSFPPGELRKLGIDVADLSRENPELVWCSITPFGLDGPRRDWKSSNLVSWASSGLLHAIGDPDRAPLVPGGPIPLAELLAALQAAVGILAAVRARATTGRGQRVDVSVHASAVAASVELGVTAFLDDMILRRRAGNRRRQLAPTGLYPTRDGYVAVVILPVAHWDALARWIHERTDNEAVLDPMFRDLGQRYDAPELLEEWVESLTRLYTKQEFFEEGQRRGISITPVNTLADLARDPQLAARGWWQEVDDPVLGRQRVAGAPYRLSRTPWQTGPAPSAG